MADTGGVDRTLRPVLEAASELAESVSQVTAEVRGADGTATTIPAAQTAVTRLGDQARDLLARLEDAGAQLAALDEAARVARSLDPELWPERREVIAAKLTADLVDGACAWLAAWARAFLLGCPAEAERLVTEPFRLPPEAGWCPDRLSVATDALSSRSVQRLVPLLRYLAAGAPLAGRATIPGFLRARALIMHARLLLHAGQPGAVDLLEQASATDHQHEAEVLAARAAMVRLSAEPGQPEATTAAAQAVRQARLTPEINEAAADLARHPTPEMEAQITTMAAGLARASALADEQSALARQAWKAERCAAAAVEMFHAERRTVDNARALVDELPAVADQEGALDVLVLPVPGEIWLAAAERAAREREFGAARRLADRISAGADPMLAAEAADLRARAAAEAGEAAGATADLLAAAGLANAVPGRGQHAIEQYTAALRLVSDHQDATLGLADALLVDNWGKRLHEVAGHFHRAVGLLDASYARHPLDARTSWSLMTYSYLASVLSNQAAAQARAREIWRAPIAAARAIAFDPAQAQRWVRLAETLIELNCDHAAAVLSSHATRLAPGDPVVQRNRIATLINLGDTAAALDLLDLATSDSADGWFSAVRAIAWRVSARGMPAQAEAERLDQALRAANEALRIEPQSLWHHLVRADILLRAGKDELAGEDFEYLWRESPLDQADGLSFATRAAVELGLGTDAVTLSTQALDVAAATVGDYGDRFNRGAALALDGDPQGLPYLESAMGIAATPFAVDYLRARLDQLAGVLRRNGIALDLGGAARALDSRAAEIAADDRPPQARIAAELDRAARNENYPHEVGELAAVAAALTQAWCGLALGDPGAVTALDSLARDHPEYPELASAAQAVAAGPLPGMEPGGAGAAPARPVPSEQELQTSLPPSWFAGLADPLDHEIIKRFVPEARARLRRRTGAVLPGVNFRDDTTLEPAGFRTELHGALVAEGRLRPRRWYCPAHLADALSPQLRAQLSSAPEAAGPAPFPVLSSFPAPKDPDPLTVLVAWPPAEVVARRMEQAYAIWQAGQAAGGAAVSGQPPRPA